MGIKKTKGTFITFVDSDDTVEKDIYTESLKEFTKNIDLVVFSYNVIKNNCIQPKQLNIKSNFNRSEFLKELPNETFRGFSWNKIYLKDIIVNNKILFDENISICEDMLFNVEYALNIKNIKFLNENYYNYKVRNDSAISGKFNLSKLSVVEAFENIFDLLNEFQYISLYKAVLIEFVIDYKNKMKIERLNDKQTINFLNEKINEYYKLVMLDSTISMKKKAKLFLKKFFGSFLIRVNVVLKKGKK